MLSSCLYDVHTGQQAATVGIALGAWSQGYQMQVARSASTAGLKAGFATSRPACRECCDAGPLTLQLRGCKLSAVGAANLLRIDAVHTVGKAQLLELEVAARLQQLSHDAVRLRQIPFQQEHTAPILPPYHPLRQTFRASEPVRIPVAQTCAWQAELGLRASDQHTAKLLLLERRSWTPAPTSVYGLLSGLFGANLGIRKG